MNMSTKCAVYAQTCTLACAWYSEIIWMLLHDKMAQNHRNFIRISTTHKHTNCTKVKFRTLKISFLSVYFLFFLLNLTWFMFVSFIHPQIIILFVYPYTLVFNPTFFILLKNFKWLFKLLVCFSSLIITSIFTLTVFISMNKDDSILFHWFYSVFLKEYCWPSQLGL